MVVHLNLPFRRSWITNDVHSGDAYTNTFSKVCIFVGSENASRSNRVPLYRFDTFSTVHTKTFENGRIARCDVSGPLCARYKHACLRYFRCSFSFWCVFVRPHKYDMYIVFALIHFQEHFFPNKNASNCMRFQTKTHKCGRSPILRDGYYTHKRVFTRVSCSIKVRENS